ncbi:hypothetical protein EVAR_79866_1 [Eumeta japonica]|uniref:Mariner Mos1 transposase n=1 Tax=Eumeta variegata TaxID=151549 RepID=A0A4C1U087_EUMVA|nr:hypothetical protein EVAR_79866_1 [Eumeta japonica]
MEAQKLCRVNRCHEIMKRFVGGDSNAVHDIVTDDERWIYCYDPETKKQFIQRMFPFEELLKKRGRSVEKEMAACFFGMTGHYATIFLEDKKTVTAH